MAIIIVLIITVFIIVLLIKSLRKCAVCGKRGGIEQRYRSVESIDNQEDRELELYYHCKYCEEETKDKEDAHQLFCSDFLNSKSVIFFSNSMKRVDLVDSESIEMKDYNKNNNIFEKINAEFIKIYNDIIVIYIEEKRNESINNTRYYLEDFKNEYIKYGKDLFDNLDYTGIAIYKCRNTNKTDSLENELEFQILAKLYLTREKADKINWNNPSYNEKIDDSIFEMLWMEQQIT